MNIIKPLIIIFLIVPLLMGCVVTLNSQEIVDLVMTEVVRTLQARSTQIAPSIALIMPLNNEIQSSSGVQSPQPIQTTLPCYMALLINETIPDNQNMKAGDAFTKTWWLRNTGSCTWKPNYQLVFSSGSQMNAPAAIYLNTIVPPSGQVAVSANFIAPNQEGIYISNWRIKSDNGIQFAQVWVKINVSSPPSPTSTPLPAPTATPAFAVTNVDLSGTQNDISVTCGLTDTFTTTAVITANGPGVVSFSWEMGTWGDSQVSPPQTVTFGAAGTRTVQYTWTTTTISWGDFNYDFLISLPAPANTYQNLIEMQCN